MTHDIQIILGRARVRIGQASELLRWPHPTASTPEDCLEVADVLWRELVRRHEDDPHPTAQVDGLSTERVIERLNDIVYELLTAAAASPR